MIELINQQEQLYNADSVDQLIDKLSNVKTNNFICAMGDLAITPTHMITPSGEHKITHTGMLTLLKKLSVPISSNYAFKVDNDQLLYDINNLLNEDEREISYRVEDDVITGFINPKFQPVEHLSIINTLLTGDDGFKVQEVKHSPSYMKVNIVTDNFVDVGNDDKTLMGLEIVNSDIGLTRLQSSLLLYRLICSNGAIGIAHSHRYIQEQLNRSEENIVESFYSRLIAYNWVLPEIGEALIHMSNNSIGAITDLVPKAHVISFDQPIEQEVDNTGINGIMYLLKGVVGKENASAILEGFDNTSSQYDVYNSITASAKQFGLDKSRKVEALGGRLVRYSISKLAA